MSEGDRWVFILGLAAISFALKAAGPIALGGRRIPPWAARVIASLGPPLMCALVATALFSAHGHWAVGAQTVGVLLAGVLLWFRVPIIVSALVAMFVTAALRQLGG